MSNLKVPKGPDADAAFTALVRFVEGGPRRISDNQPVRAAIDTSSKPDETVVALRRGGELINLWPLRQIGLDEGEIAAIVRFAETHGMKPLQVAADWLRCVMDTIEKVG